MVSPRHWDRQEGGVEGGMYPRGPWKRGGVEDRSVTLSRKPTQSDGGDGCYPRVHRKTGRVGGGGAAELFFQVGKGRSSASALFKPPPPDRLAALP